MHRFITRTVLVLAALGLTAPSVMMLEGCAVDVGQLLKGGGEKGPAAKAAGQKSGATAKSNKDKGTDLGVEYLGVTCDASDEGLGWCDDDTNIVFCAGGHFWSLDCGQIDGAVCGENVELNEMDCFAPDDFE